MQSDKYDKKLLEPTFKDFHYKFILLLPVSEYTLGSTEPAKEIFKNEDLKGVEQLFRSDFGGFTHQRSVVDPSTEGQWIKGTTNETIVNEHAMYQIYSARTREALNYFDELKERLHVRAEELGAKQDIIVIEQSEVTFAIKPPFTEEFLQLLLRRISQEGKIPNSGQDLNISSDK